MWAGAQPGGEEAALDGKFLKPLLTEGPGGRRKARPRGEGYQLPNAKGSGSPQQSELQREQFFVAGSSIIPSCIGAFIHSFTHLFTDLFIGEANIN